MSRLRLLFALLLMAVGTTFGAFALSGYFEPQVRHAKPAAAPSTAPATQLTPRTSRWARRAIVAKDAPAPKPGAARTVPAKPKPPAFRTPPVKRPQQASAPWPWSQFRN